MSAAKSPVGAVSSPYAAQDRGYGSTGYFPQQHQAHAPINADAETLSNTLANSQVEYDGQIAAPMATRPTRFTEEWDASQRGSSIADGNTSNIMQRSSYAGSVIGAAGDGAASLSRGNTLKKKASLRRSGSLKRSGSRRSMKAGSVRSLALQTTTDHNELHSAFYCPVPTSGNPTEVLANRFQGMPCIQPVFGSAADCV